MSEATATDAEVATTAVDSTMAGAVAQAESAWWVIPEAMRWPLTVLVLSALAGYLLARIGLLPLLRLTVERSRVWWDDILADDLVLRRLSRLVPLLIFQQGLPLIEGLGDHLGAGVQRVFGAAMVFVVVTAVSAVCQAANTVYARTEQARERPIKGYLQVVRLITFFLGTIILVATLIGKSPWILISGLGAMTAVLMLVFRDTILGFVAGVQITANKLIHVGDWVEMPQFNADGDVIDISLNTVQIQNWDKTISVIPAHKFLENSYKNWRGMQQSGGRRIARSIDIDLGSVRFVDDDLLAHLGTLALLKPYLDERGAEIAQWNADQGIDASIPGNGRRMTNVGCFRAYVVAYLKANPKIRQDMTFLVRQLAPGPTGLPIQIYVFTATTVWDDYEAIQADLFDHLFAILPHFGLRAYQHPSGADVRAIAPAAAAEA